MRHPRMRRCWAKMILNLIHIQVARLTEYPHHHLRKPKVTRTLFPPHSERSGNAFWPPAFGTFPERPERGPPGDLEARARSRRGTVCTSQMNNKLISAASSYNIERSLNTPLVGKVALFHATQALLAQARAPQGGDQGFRSGDTRKMRDLPRRDRSERSGNAF